MAQRTKGRRVLGPYRVRGPRWRIIVVEAAGSRAARDFETEEEATQVIRSLNREIRRAGEKRIAEAKEEYEVHLRDESRTKSAPTRRRCGGSGSFFRTRSSRFLPSRRPSAPGTTRPCDPARRSTASRWPWTHTGTSSPRRGPS